jgi:ketosteroid isomerase-like protein
MFSETDLKGLMSDYSDDAVFISEDEVLEGHDGIRGYVRGFVAGIDDQTVVFSLDEQIAVDDYTYIVWHAETPENEYEFASDTFVVRNGEIVAQTLAANVSKKG